MLNGPATEAIANADAHLNNAGLPTHTETLETLAGVLELVELLAFNACDRVDCSNDERLARAKAVLAS